MSGRLPEAFSGAGNDVVLIGHPCGRGEVLDWVRQFRGLPRFPPIVVIGNGEERQIVAVLKAGADEYVGKPGLTNTRLLEAVEGVLHSRVGRVPTPVSLLTGPSPAVEIRSHGTTRSCASLPTVN